MKSTTAIVALLLASAAYAQPTKDTAYLCVEEIAGGIAYDRLSNKWKGTSFATTGKFTLRLTFEQTRTKKTISGKDEAVDDYLISITPTNTRETATCFLEATSQPPFRGPEFRCHTFQTDYVFNLKSSRFLLAYLRGYVSGQDDQSTPHVSAGTCTRVD